MEEQATTSPTLWTTIATARAYEKAARRAYKELLKSRPDVFGDVLLNIYGELEPHGLQPETQPDDGESVTARYLIMSGLVAHLRDHRRQLIAEISTAVITATRRRLNNVKDEIEDLSADIEEAKAIGVEARIKPYTADITAEELAQLITEARRTATQARANRNDEYAEDVIMILDDLRRTIWAAVDGRPTVKHIDAEAIATAAKALTLAIEDI